jgi:hypothetical protein
MKKCTYCGKEYPDTATVCAVDGQPLVPVGTAPQSVQYRTPKLLSYIAPVKAGLVLGILYGFMGLLFMPFFIVMAIIGQKTGGGPPAAFGGIFFGILFPVLYAIGGFIGGLIGAALYNLVAKWTGGFEFEFRDGPARPVY